VTVKELTVAKAGSMCPNARISSFEDGSVIVNPVLIESIVYVLTVLLQIAAR
jgi:hypothetical protein